MTTEFDISAVADAVAEATGAALAPPPRTLPPGWIRKESRSNPGFYYYFYIPTGLTSWQPPVQENEGGEQTESSRTETLSEPGTKEPLAATTTAGDHSANSTRTASPTPPVGESKDPEDAEDRASKRRKPTSESGPKEVRVLHILKKHKDSRRPSSWRQPKITQTLEEAKEELQGLLEILLEEEGNLDELRATFEELARTESDCSSAKRGGDLGFFGRRKMQPAFEEASFGLNVGELTKEIVETSSGVHLILRIG